MNATELQSAHDLEHRLAEAEGMIEALLSGEIDAVSDATTGTPLLLSTAQAALRESEERYRRIVETAAEGISIVDTEGRFTFANRRVAQLLGYTVEELVGRSLSDVVPAGHQEIATRRLEHSRMGIAEENEVRYRRKDGSELWTWLRTTPIHDANGNHVGTLGMMTDRSSYREAEEALRRTEAQYQQIVEATTDGIIKIDAEARIVFVNRRLGDMLGYEPGEMVGQSLFDFMSDEARKTVAASLHNRQLGLKGIVDTVYRHKNGTEISVNVAGSGLRDGDGGYSGSLGVVRDMTEQRKLQAQLMVSDRMASVGTLAAGVAHEINNPLAAVIANLDLVAELLGEEQATAPAARRQERTAAWLRAEIVGPLDDAREAAQRMRSTVRDLKLFSRTPAEESPGAVDVKAIMESSLRIAWNEIRHRGQLVKQYGQVPPVAANEARLGQVFLNLLVNAAQALPEGDREHNEVRVSTRLEHERVIIEVSDTGAGIPPALIGRVFDAFFTTKAVGVGTGLGLAISQRIVSDLGGALTVESEVGKGTTFRVSLPIAAAPAIEAATPAPAPRRSDRRGRILLVDDEKAVLKVVKLILARDHEVVAVETAAEALALCVAGERFALIMCDLMMPGMTGMELHAELAHVAPGQANRMIFLTGGAFTDKARHFLSDMPKEFIEKPFDAANLRAIVQRHLRASVDDD